MRIGAKSISATLCSFLLWAVLPISPSAAAKSNWSNEKPIVSGPVEYHDKVCFKSYRGGSGQRACGFWYSWPLASEIHPIQDFGTLWIQHLVEPADGMCVFDVRIRVYMPGDYAIPEGEYAPNRTLATKKPREVLTELETDAGGWSPLPPPATFKSRSKWTLFPVALEQPREREGPLGTRALEWKWTGKQKGPMRFAVGVTYNWNVVTGLINETVFGIPPIQFAAPVTLVYFQDCDEPPPEPSPFDDLLTTSSSREEEDGSTQATTPSLGLFHESVAGDPTMLRQLLNTP